MSKIIAIFLMVIGFGVYASQDNTVLWFQKDKNNEVELFMDMFSVSTCKHCQAANIAIKPLEKKYKWLHIRHFIIDQNVDDLDRFHEDLIALNSNNYAVPAFIFCNTQVHGFAKGTISALEKALLYCRSNIMQDNNISSKTISVLHQIVTTDVISSSLDKNVINAISLGLLDTFMPCTLFIPLMFGILLWRYRLNYKDELKIGVTFLGALFFSRILEEYNVILYTNLVYATSYLSLVLALAMLVLISVEFHYKRLKAVKPTLLSYLVALSSAWFFVGTQKLNCKINTFSIVLTWFENPTEDKYLYLLYIILYNIGYFIPYIIVLLGYRLLKDNVRVKKYLYPLESTVFYWWLLVALVLILYPQGVYSFSCSLMVIILGILGRFIYAPQRN